MVLGIFAGGLCGFESRHLHKPESSPARCINFNNEGENMTKQENENTPPESEAPKPPEPTKNELMDEARALNEKIADLDIQHSAITKIYRDKRDPLARRLRVVHGKLTTLSIKGD